MKYTLGDWKISPTNFALGMLQVNETLYSEGPF